MRPLTDTTIGTIIAESTLLLMALLVASSAIGQQFPMSPLAPNTSGFDVCLASSIGLSDSTNGWD